MRIITTLLIFFTATLIGCRSASPQNDYSTKDLNGDLAKASAAQEPAIVLVIEAQHSGADDRAWGTLQNAISPSDRIATVALDISDSRNRAEAARFHVIDTPLLLCMSAKGVIVSRDKGPVTTAIVRGRVSELKQRAPELDAKLTALQQQAAQKPNDPAASFPIAEFLLDQKNCLEAIGYLQPIAHADSTEINLRMRAWVDLCRAHAWIGEPEKARHEARDLIATLGEKIPQAKAGGNLVLGTLDATAKRTDRARQELQDAIAAAPDSEYAQEAAINLTQLPSKGD